MQISLDELKAKLLEEELKDMFKQAYEQGISDARKKYELPLLLTRRQFMELANISEAKCARLFNRQDFPVNREFGHPRVPTKLLFDWIYVNTNWVETIEGGVKLSDSFRS